MGLIVRFDQRALSDLRGIRDYLLPRSPTGAERVRRHILETIERLADFPFLGRRTDEASVRVLPLTRYPYLVFYSVVNNEIVILCHPNPMSSYMYATEHEHRSIPRAYSAAFHGEETPWTPTPSKPCKRR